MSRLTAESPLVAEAVCLLLQITIQIPGAVCCYLLSSSGEVRSGASEKVNPSHNILKHHSISTVDKSAIVQSLVLESYAESRTRASLEIAAVGR